MSNFSFKDVVLTGNNVFGDVYGSYAVFTAKNSQLNESEKNLARVAFKDEALSDYKNELLKVIAEASKEGSGLPKESKSLFEKIKSKVVEAGSNEAASALIAYLLEKAPSWREIIGKLSEILPN